MNVFFLLELLSSHLLYSEFSICLSAKHILIKPWGDLRIDKTLLSDSGVYTCVAENANEKISASATITVYRGKIII